MSILPDRNLINIGPTLIQPFDPEWIQPASIDVHLDRYFAVAERSHFGTQMSADSNNDDMFKFYEVARTGYMILQPGDFVLASVFQKVTVPPMMVARFEGKSSLARKGLLVHITAGFIDPGFSGHITLEIKNLMPAPWRLEPGIEIGQICFELLVNDAKFPYGNSVNGSHYQNSKRGPTLSRSHEGYTKIDVF